MLRHTEELDYVVGWMVDHMYTLQSKKKGQIWIVITSII